MSRPLLRRRKKIIKPGFQIKIALIAALSLLAYSIIFGLIIFYPLSKELFAAVSIEDQARVSEVILELHKRLWPAVIIVSLLVCVQAILGSHRVAGPIYRFEKAVGEFLRGDFTRRIKLRKNDEFKEVEEMVNSLGDYLESARDGDAELHASIKKELEKVLSILNEGKDLDRAATIARGLIAKIDDAPDAFSNT